MMDTKQYLTETKMLDYLNPTIQKLIEDRIGNNLSV